jgi:hypothetical protein
MRFRCAGFPHDPALADPPADLKVQPDGAESPRLTPRQEYIASVCRECDDNLICPKAYAEGCSALQTCLRSLDSPSR